MAKLTEYPQATEFDPGDILIKDGTNGTKKIEFEDVFNITSGGIAKIFSESENFYKGDYAFYNHKIYKFDADHLKTAWTGTDVTERKPVTDLYVGHNNIENLTGVLKEVPNAITSDNFALGKYLRYADGAVTSNSSYLRTDLLPGYMSIAAFEFTDPNYSLWISYYDADGTLGSAVGTVGYLGHSASLSPELFALRFIPNVAAKFAISFHRIDSQAATETDITNILAALKFYKLDISGNELSQTMVRGAWNANFKPVTSGVSDNTLRSKQEYPITNFLVYSDDGYQFSVNFGIERSSPAAAPRSSSYRTSFYAFDARNFPNLDAKFFGINIKKPVDAESEEITDEEIETVASKVHVILTSTDTSLKNAGSPADAFVVGNVIGNMNPWYVAERNYEVGELLVSNGRYFKVTRAISAGATITSSTNVTPTSIGEELADLGSSKLPSAPAEDGTYTLKCTVANGVLTKLWVADT